MRDAAYLEGKEQEFKVIKLDRRRNNVVVSRRAVVEQEYSAEREALLQNLQEGQIVEGVVRISPTMVPSSTLAVLMACCTSPTWLGDGSSILPR